ncbi:PucR family transcriptional regulator (plasmid) [Streptomyces sp. WAC00288]|uniref:helix-turn-helix domain-containing protein n=1 Tax=unclassified Streptomyces TaxID=2593676 RepID=UPI00099FFEE1|nr:PucR family transcriptional regulator [Streptomyces sp. WAC00288]
MPGWSNGADFAVAQRSPHLRSQGLGAFVNADPDLTLTLRTYLDEERSTARIAERLYSHRSTVGRWLGHCDELLPRRVADGPVGIAAAPPPARLARSRRGR